MEEKQIDDAISKTLEYYNYCKKSEWIKPPPFLKGTIGEFIALKFLRQYFGNLVEYYGGRTRGFDIKISSFKIQVKTSHHNWNRNPKREFIEYDSSPEIDSTNLDETDFIIWVIIHLDKDYILKKFYLYIFDSKKEGQFFKNTGWHGKDINRKQIVKISGLLRELPKEMKAKKRLAEMQRMIEIYDTKEYHDLFSSSEGENGIKKIKERLHN